MTEREVQEKLAAMRRRFNERREADIQIEVEQALMNRQRRSIGKA